MVWVLGTVIALQVAESNLLVPRVMDKAVGVNAVVSMLAIAAFGALFGFAGALLAVPLAAVLQILFTRLVLDPSVSKQAVTMSALEMPAAPRHHQARLQMQSQELAQDARKLARTYSERHDLEGELLIDEIEILANRLDAYLAGQEGNA
jgi:nucleotide-binding universal stress UspA family protein